MKTVMLFFQFFIYPILHSDCCYLTEPKCGLRTRFPGYITSLPLCPQPPSQHLATICAFWTASGAAGARFRPPQKAGCCPAQRAGGCKCQKQDIWHVMDPFFNNSFFPGKKGDETHHFHAINSQKQFGTQKLASATFSVGKQTWPCLPNCSMLPKVGIAAKHYPPWLGLVAEWHKTGKTDVGGVGQNPERN